MIVSPKRMWDGLEKGDRYMLLSGVVVPLAFWWYYIGRERYGTKGMK
jgi:hypothetical protein